MIEIKPEQRKVITHTSGNLLVSASAGSGKTFVMIERLINLICSNKATVNELLAVTFTESAAHDMKEKLRKALIERICKGQTELNSQLFDVSTANISTMHAFCAKLIRTYFFVVGVSPDFKVLDQVSASEIEERSLKKTLKALYDSDDQDLKKLLAIYSYKYSDKKLREKIKETYHYASVEADPERFYAKPESVYTKENFVNIVEIYKKHVVDTAKKQQTILDQCIKHFETIGAKKSEEFCKVLFADLYLLIEKGIESAKLIEFGKASFDQKLDEVATEYKNRAVKVRDWLKDTVNKIKVVLPDEQTAYQNFCVQKEYAVSLMRVVKEFDKNYSQEKRDENGLDFSDLEHFALKVLSDEQALEEIKAKFKYVFVDEYQDTNGVQEEIITKITKDNLFMVGDLKQSIYGFRGCRAEFFEEKYKALSCNEQTATLNCNFRSAQKVIDLVNEIFDYCMTEQSFGLNYKDQSRLVHGGIFDVKYAGRAELHFLEAQPRKTQEMERPRIYDILEELKPEQDQFKNQTLLICDIIFSELGKKFYDAKLGIERQVTLGDIAIISRNKKSEFIDNLTKSLIKFGVPVSSEAEQNICDYPEVQLLINLVRLLDCFYQDLPLCAVLLSPFGRFCEEDLAEIVLQAKKDKVNANCFSDAFNHYIKNTKTQLADRLNSFKCYFDKMRFVADFSGAFSVLEKMINESGYEDCLYASPLGEDKVKRVKNFLSKAKNKDKLITVREFLKLIDSNHKAFGFSTVCDSQTVKLMTIHASKGLEFPVVIVCNLEKKFNRDDEKKDIIKDRELGIAVKHYDFEQKIYAETLLREVAKLKIRESLVKEEMRLFYVALTRATYSLHLISEGKKNDQNLGFETADCFADFIPATLNVTVHDQQDLQSYVHGQSVDGVIVGAPNTELQTQIARNLEYAYPHLQDLKFPVKTSVSKVAAESKQEYYKVENLFDEQEDFTSAESGVIAHKIMEYYDFSSGVALAEQVDAMVKNGIITKDQANFLNLERIKIAIDNAFNSEVLGRLYREAPFIAEIDAKTLLNTSSNEKIMVQGIIDLLVIEGDYAKVIDYKYSKKSKEQLLSSYSLQLNVYAQAVENVLGKKVTKKTIMNLYTGETVNVNF